MVGKLWYIHAGDFHAWIFTLGMFAAGLMVYTSAVQFAIPILQKAAPKLDGH